MTDKQTSKVTAAKPGAKKANAPVESEQPAWPSFAGAAGAQMDGVKALGEVSALLAKMAQDLGAQQTAFMKANAETIQNAAAAYGESDPSARFARQSNLYRDFMERSADHVSAVAETISGCCCEAMDQMTEAATETVNKAAQLGVAEKSQK